MPRKSPVNRQDPATPVLAAEGHTPFSIAGLASRYEGQPLVRALVQLVPFGIGSMIDVLLLSHVERIRERRLRIFFDELSAGRVLLTPELVRNEDFLHCFFATVAAAGKTRRAEKIRAFARLLLSTATDDGLRDPDEYEEYLSILDELSWREMVVLTLLDRFEKQYPKEPDENDLQRTSRFWSGFEGAASQRLNVTHDEIAAILARLNRSGCYLTLTGTYLDYRGDRGKLTPVFLRLKRAVGDLTQDVHDQRISPSEA